MARTRSISFKTPENEELAELSPWHRLLFIYLWTIVDREGRIEDRPLRIKAKLLPYDNVPFAPDVMLEDLANAGFIRRYEVNGIKTIQVVNFKKHQRPHPKEQPSVLPAPPSSASEESHGIATAIGGSVSTKSRGDAGTCREISALGSSYPSESSEPSEPSGSSEKPGSANHGDSASPVIAQIDLPPAAPSEPPEPSDHFVPGALFIRGKLVDPSDCGWVRDFGDAWREAYGAEHNQPLVLIGDVAPIREQIGHGSALERWRRYLACVPAQYASSGKFARTHGAYANDRASPSGSAVSGRQLTAGEQSMANVRRAIAIRKQQRGEA